MSDAALRRLLANALDAIKGVNSDAFAILFDASVYVRKDSGWTIERG